MKMKGELVGTSIRKSSGDVVRSHAHIAMALSEHARLLGELIQAVDARDEFIAIAAHELRNPMTPILGYVEHMLAISRRPENVCPEVIIIALERLAVLIAEYIKRATTLLDVSRITAGKLRAELSVVDLSATMRQVVYRNRADAARSGFCLEASIEDG